MDAMGLNKNAPGIERILNRVVYRLFFGSACIDPLLDDRQLLCSQVGKVLRFLYLHQSALVTISGYDHWSVLSNIHDTGVAAQIQAG